MGLLLEARADLAPAAHEPFLIADLQLRVQAVSRRAEALLGVGEDIAVGRPVSEFLVPAEAEQDGAGRLVDAIVAAAAGEQEEGLATVPVRPFNTHGVRISARVTHCGPPLAALLVLERPDDRNHLRLV